MKSFIIIIIIIIMALRLEFVHSIIKKQYSTNATFRRLAPPSSGTKTGPIKQKAQEHGQNPVLRATVIIYAVLFC
jgi:hypothetical protein